MGADRRRKGGPERRAAHRPEEAVEVRRHQGNRMGGPEDRADHRPVEAVEVGRHPEGAVRRRAGLNRAALEGLGEVAGYRTGYPNSLKRRLLHWCERYRVHQRHRDVVDPGEGTETENQENAKNHEYEQQGEN